MKKIMRLLAFLALSAMLGFVGSALAQSAVGGQLMRVQSRPGVTVPLYTIWRSDAVATLVLFSGGDGGFGKLGSDGWPASENFLIRTGKLWAGYPFNVVMVGRPSDGIDLGDGAVRIGPAHAADNLAVYQAIKARSKLPIWLVGTSMGTISAAASAIQDKDLISGLVLTSSVTSAKRAGAVPSQDLAKVRVPTLVVHNAKDACKICVPADAGNIAGRLKNSPVTKTVIVNGGSGASGDPCGAHHYHGFIGMEKSVVDLISAWILRPVS